MTDYDIIIIGAGISGIYCALELSKKYKVLILEKYDEIGGRISTFRGPVQWERGAGRIHSSHKMVLDLLKRYGLEVVPISEGIEWRGGPMVEPKSIEFSSYIRNLGIDQLEPKLLKTHTLNEAITKITGVAAANIMTDRYEYRSEIFTQRADKSLEVLRNELGSHSGFCVVKTGFDSLIHAMKQDLDKAGVTILGDSEVQDVLKIRGGDNKYKLIIRGQSPITCSKVVVTIPRDSLAELPCFKKLPILKQVTMRPLVRIYAIFPSKPTAWFEGISKFVCPKPLRYVIPLNSKNGSIMISYTDGVDAEYWINKRKKDNIEIKREIMRDIRALFPDKSIPEPTTFKMFVWKDGCSYWAPGDYDIKAVSMNSVIPLPNSMPGVYMCGESWAYNQSWVESALQQSRMLLDVI